VNLWWPLFIALGCAWVLPLIGIKSAGNVGWPFFVALGVLWAALFVWTRPLYDFGTYLLRKLKWTKMARWREEMKPRVLPPVRVALLIMAVSSFAAAFL